MEDEAKRAPERAPERAVVPEEHGRSKTLEAIGWGVALLWVGVSLLLAFGWALVLMGLGILTLVMQGLRVSSGLKVEQFWLILGAVFLVAGAWQSLSGMAFPLVPVALILLGIAILGNVWIKRGKSGG